MYLFYYYDDDNDNNNNNYYYYYNNDHFPHIVYVSENVYICNKENDGLNLI